MPTYNPKKVILTVLGLPIIGFAEDTFIKVSRNEDLFSVEVGADGNVTRVMNANKTGRFEITLQQSSPSNSALYAQVNLDERTGRAVGPTLLKDGNDVATFAEGLNSWVVKAPDLGRGKKLNQVDWIIEAEEVNILQSGTI